MTAKMISEMIRKVTRRKVSPNSILTTAMAYHCHGRRSADGTKTFNSDEIATILRHYELNPEAFVGRG